MIVAAIDPLIVQLKDKHSPKRRSAALKLRKLADQSAGPALLEALQEELKDVRTWETQYQMIMALGESGYKSAIPLLEKLANQRFEATTILVAVGDAYVRLARKSDTDSTPVLKILGIDADRCLADGALRAVAMLRMKFSEAEVASIIHAVDEHTADPKDAEALKFWLIAACPGWTGIEVDQFIERCSRSTREDVRNAAADAKLKKYRKWRPL